MNPPPTTLRTFTSCLWPLEWPTALAAALAAVVPGVSLWFHAPFAWLAGTVLLVVVIEHAGAAIHGTPARLAVVGIAIAAVHVANVLLGASYFVQQEGFNDVFFAHLDRNVILPGIPMFGKLVALIAANTILGLAVALRAARRVTPRPFSWPLRAMTLTAVLLFAPVFQGIAYRVSRYRAARTSYDLARVLPPAAPRPPAGESASAPEPAAGSPAPPAAALVTPPAETPRRLRPDSRASLAFAEAAGSSTPAARAVPARRPRRNLVLLYLEGLEQAFLDVPGLMPRLSALRSRVLHFSNVHGVVGSTIGGLVSTQCGWPPFTDQELYQARTFYPGLRCLGDELKASGYHCVFMEGFTPQFTRYDSFFGTHGFAEVLGRDELLPLTPDPGYTNEKWGVEDDALLLLARARFEALARGDAPFLLSLITVDTHVPGFVARSCSRYAASDDNIQQAVHCTDQLVGDFVDFVHASSVADRTVIALVSDHLLWGGIADHGLKVPDHERRLTFLLDVPGAAAREIRAKGTELDIGPTLAEVLELKLTVPGRIGLGSSLLAGDGFLWTPESGVAGNVDAIQTFTRSDTVRDFVKAARDVSE